MNLIFYKRKVYIFIMLFTRRNRSLPKYIFILIIVLTMIAYLELFRENKSASREVVKVNPENSGQLLEKLELTPKPDMGKGHEHLSSEEVDIVIERQKAANENTDEFLASMLKDYEYMEIDLRSKRIHGKSYEDDEKGIKQYLSKIVPGLGDGGLEAKVPKAMAAQAEEIKKKEAFNLILSDMVSPNRTIPDGRQSVCKSVRYDPHLPDATVVIIYSNEALSTLLRTIHSVVNRSAPHLLKEVILVDDFSDKSELKGTLERYLATTFHPGKVRLVKLKRRSGLIRAKMVGAHLTTGQVIVFLDAHCEASNGWLEPLLQRIKAERTAVVTPIVDIIDGNDLRYAVTGNGFSTATGGFAWSLHFTWIYILPQTQMEKPSPLLPVKTPSMIGGLLAIDRKYFWEIGSYDPGMDLWGGENLEMSFRVWQCGGSVETIPCSRVGHMFRAFHPHIPGHGNNGKSHALNSARVAEVWMDEYKELYLYYNNLQKSNYGDISRRLALRERLKCKNFKWYLDNIYKEKFQMTKASTHAGQIENPATQYCLDNLGGDQYYGNYSVGLYPCHRSVIPYVKHEQNFYLSYSGELRREFVCGFAAENNTILKMDPCKKLTPGQKWEYTDESILRHSPSGKCLTVELSGGKANLTLEDCMSPVVPSQQWGFEKTSNHKK